MRIHEQVNKRERSSLKDYKDIAQVIVKASRDQGKLRV